MTKVIGMLVALAMFCAMPAAAFGEPDEGGPGNPPTTDGNPPTTGGNSPPTGGNGVSSGDIKQTIGSGDNNTQCAISQAAGGDAVATNNCGNVTKVKGGVTRVHERGVGGGGVGGGGVGGGGIGGGAQGVRLAVTGFDAWMFAVIGGLSLAGGLGLLAAQRRGRIGA